MNQDVLQDLLVINDLIRSLFRCKLQNFSARYYWRTIYYLTFKIYAKKRSSVTKRKIPKKFFRREEEVRSLERTVHSLLYMAEMIHHSSCGASELIKKKKELGTEANDLTWSLIFRTDFISRSISVCHSITLFLSLLGFYFLSYIIVSLNIHHDHDICLDWLFNAKCQYCKQMFELSLQKPADL